MKTALETEKRIVAVFAGWRTGKTDYVSIEHAIRRQAYDNGDCLHLIAANTYSQLIDSTLRTLFAKLDWMAIPHIPEDLPKSARPLSLHIWNGTKWVEFLCRSMDNFDIVAGVTLGSAWLDEVWATEKWTFDLALSRLSDSRSRHLQLVLTTTKDEPAHWMYTDIVEPFERNTHYGDGSARDVIEVVEGTTYDNAPNLADGYIEQQQATLDQRLFDRFIGNRWISTAEGIAYTYYEPDVHRRILPWREELPIVICCDFNLTPCIWLIGQTSEERTHMAREIVQRSTDIWRMCAATKSALIDIAGGSEERARTRPVIVYGDYQHGTGRSLSATSNSWEIIEREFAGWKVEIRKKSNPRIVDRVNATNARMRAADGRVRYTHDPQCVELGKDYQTVTHDMLRNIASQGERTHAASAVDYMMNYEYPLRPQATGRQL